MLRRLSENRVAMGDFNSDEWQQNVAATENLESLKKWQLENHLQYFTEVQPQLTLRHYSTRDTCKERIELLRAEIRHRRSRKPSWTAIAALIIAVMSFFGLQKCFLPSFTQTEARPTPTETATPEPSATGTPSQ
jgi:hypothetical protein